MVPAASENSAYAAIGRKWKAATKAVLGGEIGDFSEYEGWLSSIRTLRSSGKSSLSGKEVFFTHSEYPQKARTVALDEIDFNKKYAPLNINSLKDIDSIIEAVSERAIYTGNVVLGNSRFVEKSSGVLDCNYIYRCDRIAHSTYVAHSTIISYCECAFGVEGSGNSSFVIKGGCNMFVSRCLEASKCDNSSDIYYCHGLSGCADCMFSFNMKSRRNCIGNLQLPREKYLEIKAKLLSEMREMLKREKRLPHITSLAGSCKPDYSEMKKAMGKMPAPPSEKPDTKPVETAFSKTTGLLFGVSRQGVDKYGEWLKRHVNPVYEQKSCASGKRLLLSEHSHFMLFPRDRLINIHEADFLGENLKISEEEAGSISLQNAAGTISKLAYFCPDWEMGNVGNLSDCLVAINSNTCHKCILPINSKLCSHYYWPRDSEHLFGGNETRTSSFCINTYHSEKLARCFEVDSSWNCSGCYFCHDCENVHDSMFCFNVKNMKYAIGNIGLPREQYLEIKKRVLVEINAQLDKEAAVRQSIFSIGAKR